MRNNRFKPVKKIVKVFLLMCFSLYIHAQNAAVSQEARVDSLYGYLNKTASPGIAVAVVRDGKIIFRKGYGLANVEHRIPITPTSSFDIASLDKQFIGSLISMLILEGKISRNDNISKYIPELSDLGNITIDHLLHHTSGVRDWVGSLYLSGSRADDPVSVSDILNFAYRQKSLNFNPGSQHLYSNTGYILLAELIRRITSKSYSEWSKEKVFDPLNMVHTKVVDNYNEILSERAYAYKKNNDGSYRNAFELRNGAIYSTVDDLAKWMINFDSETVGGQQGMTLMKTRGKLNNGTTIEYASGITHGSYKGLQMFTSFGSWGGYNSFDVYFPEQKFGIVVLSNNPSVNAQNAAIQISNIFFEHDFKLETKSASKTQSHPKVPDFSHDALTDFTGVYKSSKNTFINIDRVGTTLFARIPGTGTTILSSISQKEFVTDNDKHFHFKYNTKSKVESVSYDDLLFNKITKDDWKASVKLTEYVGYYDSDELGASYQVILKDSQLVLVTRRRPNLSLASVWPDGFSSLNGYFALIEFDRDETGSIKAFRVNGDARSRNNLFMKRK